jgi:hypothetical protein
MAVVQISRIQVRRGKENTDTGIPQLASGEMAWAIDTQQLYIGNGSVSEGAPAVGNTRILSSADLVGERNILNIAEYVYKKDPNLPPRHLQDRLDERVNFASFNDTRPSKNKTMAANIQSAIDFLYKDTLEKRAVLEFGPGIYQFSTPIRIHSFTHIVGAGRGRTIFRYTGTGSAFRLVNDQTTFTSAPANTDSNQCRYVNLSDFTLTVDNSNATAMQLNSVRDSEFSNLEIKSNWMNNVQGQDLTNSKAFDLESSTELIACSDNVFDNINISKFRIALNARGDINSNLIQNCNFSTNEVAINFGQDADLSSYGQVYGPRNNIISNNTFKNIQKQGIKIYNGTGNVSSQNKFTQVGDNFGNSLNAAYGVVEFDIPGNLITNDSSDRHADLSNDLYSKPYISEVIAKANYVNPFTNVKLLEYTTTPTHILRLPIAQPCHLEVEYLYQSTNKNRIRRGKLSILADPTHPDISGNPTIEFVDEYDYHGTGLNTDYTIEDVHLIFTASSKTYFGGIKYDVEIFYQFNGQTLSQGEQAKLTYTYKILS